MPSKKPSPEVPEGTPSKRKEFTAGPNDQDRRLDALVRRFLPNLGLGGLQKALRQGDIRLNGKKASPDTRVSQGDVLSVWQFLLESGQKKPSPTGKKAKYSVEEWIVARSEEILIINKPKGLLVHSGEGDSRGQPLLEVLVADYLKDKISAGLSFRPGPLHRLDRQTSGLLAFSASLEGARKFSALMQGHGLRKIYLTLLEGRMLTPHTRHDPIARDEKNLVSQAAPQGREAQTQFTPLAWSENHTLALAEISSGRTHQIRVHAQEAGHPLAGDSKYGSRTSRSDGEGGLPGYGWFLHAWLLVFPQKDFGWSQIQAPLPMGAQELLTAEFGLSPQELDALLEKTVKNII